MCPHFRTIQKKNDGKEFSCFELDTSLDSKTNPNSSSLSKDISLSDTDSDSDTPIFADADISNIERFVEGNSEQASMCDKLRDYRVLIEKLGSHIQLLEKYVVKQIPECKCKCPIHCLQIFNKKLKSRPGRGVSKKKNNHMRLLYADI
jgi:hypothetical protein